MSHNIRQTFNGLFDNRRNTLIVDDLCVIFRVKNTVERPLSLTLI